MPELPNGVPETESPDGKKKRKIAEDFLNEPKAPLEETWEPLEPHEVVTIAKPIRKGRRKKPPVGKPGVGVDASKVVKSFTKSRGGPAAKTNSIYDNTATNNSQNVRVIVPIEEFLIQVIIFKILFMHHHHITTRTILKKVWNMYMTILIAL